MLLQVMLCGLYKPLPLDGGDAHCRATEAGIAAQPYFNEDQCFAVAHDEIDFTEAAVVVARQQLQALLLEVGGSQCLGLAAQLLQGRCSTVTPSAPNLATASSRVISPAGEMRILPVKPLIVAGSSDSRVMADSRR